MKRERRDEIKPLTAIMIILLIFAHFGFVGFGFAYFPTIAKIIIILKLSCIPVALIWMWDNI